MYINHVYWGLIERNNTSVTLDIPPKGGLLDILVESMGRLNYGAQMTDRKGILGDIFVNEQALQGWEMFRLGMKNITVLQWKPVDERDEAAQRQGPAFYRSFVEIEETADTFINPKGWTKGHIYANGFNLGRYWTVGPQLTLYVPEPLLRPGTNEFVCFEISGTDRLTMSLDDVHQIDI